jgi:hypothetical protein
MKLQCTSLHTGLFNHYNAQPLAENNAHVVSMSTSEVEATIVALYVEIGDSAWRKTAGECPNMLHFQRSIIYNNTMAAGEFHYTSGF